tara:strand:- start:2638 stop:3807 length:1170 start_codon:yes stop_codon:yes gene_type:complete
MLSIIITNNNKENIIEINKYINHIKNINKNINLEIEILIINFNWNWDINNLKKNLNNTINKLNIKLYNYKCDYNDSIHNEILKNCLYDIILYTTLNTYLTEPILEYISLNKIKENSYIRTNIIELNEIPTEFFENYTNDIFNNISEELKYICNENGKQELLKNDYINEFNNNNNNIINISNENINKHNLHYLNNSTDFLLISKKIVLNNGFNINNSNIQYTIQYLLLNLIKNKYNMIKLPLLLSVFKKFNNNNTLYLLNPNIDFNCSIEYKTYINYKIYNVIEQKEKSYIRNHIKQLTGIHSNNLVEINKKLMEENNNQLRKIKEYKKEIEETNKLKIIFQNKCKELEEKYEKIYSQNIQNKETYLNKLCIINSNINEIIINEKKNLFE